MAFTTLFAPLEDSERSGYSKGLVEASQVKRTILNHPEWQTFTGVDQTTPLGSFASTFGAGTDASTTVSSAADELVFEVEEDKVDPVRRQVVELMNGAAKLSVPLQVDVGVGVNWDEAH